MTDPLPPVSDDDPYYWDEKWSEHDEAMEDFEDTSWFDKEVDLRWQTS